MGTNRDASAITTWGTADDGSTIEVSVPAGFGAQVDELWPALGLVREDVPVLGVDRTVTVVPGVAGTLLVEVDGGPSFGGWERVESEMALFAAERLEGLVAVHAAVFAQHDRAVLVPGPTGTGKSQLCVAATEAGAVVLSDEYALVVPATGLVTGWRRSVRVRRADGGVDRFDLARPTEPMPVALVALVAYQPGTELRVDEVAASQAVLGILANTVCAQSRPQEAMDAALAIARSCPAVSGTRGEAVDAVRGLLARVPS